MANFKPVRVSNEGTIVPYLDGQFIAATVPFSNGIRTYVAGLYIDFEGERKGVSVNLSAYPVGSVYKSTDPTSPASLFGGTWVQVEGRMLIGAGTSDATYTAGATGGASWHTLTAEELAFHRHAMEIRANSTGFGDYYPFPMGNDSGTLAQSWTAMVQNDGTVYTNQGGQPHNNMPPYYVVYMWVRTA